MKYAIAFSVVAVGQLVMHFVNPESPVSRPDVVFGAFEGLLFFWIISRARSKP